MKACVRLTLLWEINTGIWVGYENPKVNQQCALCLDSNTKHGKGDYPYSETVVICTELKTNNQTTKQYLIHLIKLKK